MKRVVIIVEGGIVQDVFGNGIEYAVVDWDEHAVEEKLRMSIQEATPMKYLTSPKVRKLLKKEGW